VEPTSSSPIRLFVVLIAISPPDSLITARAEGPAAILGRWPVSGQQNNSDVRGLPSVVQGSEELIDGVGPERIADLRPIDGDPHSALPLGPVVGDVAERESVDRRPTVGIEVLGDHRGSVNPGS
jgi:hypothetical protein